MKSKLLLLVAVFSLLTLSAFGQNAAELRSRMAARLSAIDDLKAKGAIGENNRGMVEVRDASASNASSVVAEENRDREAVYAIIAKETGASPDSVARARAKQIAANSRGGVWVQDESGEWKKK
ncbi:MAG: hypothetical protein JWQ62_2784 [Lacunisphaera sp.]|jgi:uncharacterized protein YdbL (DUF1318 family)|nr:hypothetical protein [Lacunisphaera sp.]